MQKTRSDPELGEVAPERDQRIPGLFDGPQASRRDPEEPLGSAATFGRGIADCRRDEPVPFEPVQRGVDGAEHHTPPPGAFDLLRDADTVGLVARPQRGEQDHQLEVGEEVALHIFIVYEETRLLVNAAARTTG